MAMRSPRAFAGSAVLLAGVPIAFLSILVSEGIASPILHLALGACFALIASAVFDFRLPAWVNAIAGVAFAVLAATFALQGVSDFAHAPPLAGFAYGVLGQYLEKGLGYVFILWCALVVWRDSRGPVRAFGVAAVAVSLAVDAYGHAAPPAPEALKLLDLLLFLWLAAESLKSRPLRSP